MVLLENQRNGTFKDISKEAGAGHPGSRASAAAWRSATCSTTAGSKPWWKTWSAVQPSCARRAERNHHWIGFQLEGVKSNRLALNARVRVISAPWRQLGEVLSGGSYLSQNDLRLHFGLGDHEKADKAEVLWPDGKDRDAYQPCSRSLLHRPGGRGHSFLEGSGNRKSPPSPLILQPLETFGPVVACNSSRKSVTDPFATAHPVPYGGVLKRISKGILHGRKLTSEYRRIGRPRIRIDNLSLGGVKISPPSKRLLGRGLLPRFPKATKATQASRHWLETSVNAHSALQCAGVACRLPASVR